MTKPGTTTTQANLLLRALLGAAALAGAALPACGGPDVPEHPTWANVEPIVRAQCSSCHGASAAITGGGTRFDFYDMTADLCGDAVQAMDPDISLAGVL